ncbi:hypothetical protein L7F22_039829 [Adiantum nelumboides]|nr:hypothetical protein [Adiantum nelumboides]
MHGTGPCTLQGMAHQEAGLFSANCGDVLRGSLTRVTRHFTWVMGVGGHGCERVPESMFYAYGGAKTRWQEVNSKLRPPLPQNLIDEKLARAIQEESVIEEARDAKKRTREEVHEESYSTQAATTIANVSGSQEGGRSSTPGASSHMGESRSVPPIVSSSQIHTNVSKKSKQHVAPHLQKTLASRFAPKLKKEAKIAEQQLFYQCNLAFRIARSPAYHRFYNTLVFAAAARATGLRPVNAEALRTTLEESGGTHQERVRGTAGMLATLWIFYYIRWVERTYCAGTTLLRVIDASMPGLSITGDWIYERIRKAIEDVGPKNVVQVVTDNGSNCASMGRMIDETYPHIVWTPCATHSLDLLFKPAKTRFGYLFLVLQRLVQSKDVLRRFVCSVEWSNWNGSRKPKATAMCDHILSNSFWDNAEAIKQAVSPLYFILRLFDHEGATMSFVMRCLGTCMTTCNTLSRERKDDLVQLWNERFDWFHKPIHIITYMLHPLYKKLSHWNDRKLIEAWTRYIETVYATDDCSLIEEESILFSQDRDYFARPIALKEENKQQAVSWWEINGGLTPTLQRLALRTLSQECTSGAAERIWSIYADIHTKKRNRLSTSQLHKLMMYVNANLRLLEILRLRDGNGGVLQWKVKDNDASVIADLERGLACGETIDITFIQHRSDEDLA